MAKRWHARGSANWWGPDRPVWYREAMQTPTRVILQREARNLANIRAELARVQVAKAAAAGN